MGKSLTPTNQFQGPGRRCRGQTPQGGCGGTALDCGFSWGRAVNVAPSPPLVRPWPPAEHFLGSTDWAQLGLIWMKTILLRPLELAMGSGLERKGSQSAPSGQSWAMGPA